MTFSVEDWSFFRMNTVKIQLIRAQGEDSSIPLALSTSLRKKLLDNQLVHSHQYYSAHWLDLLTPTVIICLFAVANHMYFSRNQPESTADLHFLTLCILIMFSLTTRCIRLQRQDSYKNISSGKPIECDVKNMFAFTFVMSVAVRFLDGIA